MLDALVAEARLRWGLDPADGLQVVAAERLIGSPLEASRPAPDRAPRDPAGGAGRVRRRTADASPLPGRNGPGGDAPTAVLRRLYPGDHVVGPDRADRDDRPSPSWPRPTSTGAIYLAPVAPELAVASPWSMPWISARLRQPDGCPWDREQTHESLRKHLLEETYEVYDALEAGATPALAEELGDLLLQVVLHAQLAAEAGVFDLTDVQAALATKIVRRHPHVFGDAEAATASDVNRQWERIKAAERATAAADATDEASDGDARAPTPRAPSTGSAGHSRRSPPARRCRSEPPTSATTGRPSTGSSTRSSRRRRSCARPRSDAHWAEEFGDLLFVLVNVARRQGVEAEAAMRAANAKFRRRFASVERQAAEQGVALRDLDFAALDTLWDNAKAAERTS